MVHIIYIMLFTFVLFFVYSEKKTGLEGFSTF